MMVTIVEEKKIPFLSLLALALSQTRLSPYRTTRQSSVERLTVQHHTPKQRIRVSPLNMGQSQSAKFDKLFTLICTDNSEELGRQLRSCSSTDQTVYLSNLSDTDKAATLLMYAAFYDNVTICRLLLDSGAKLLSRDNEGRNALFYAIAGQAYKVLQYFIETALKKFDGETRTNFINNADNTGETCLHEAVKVHAVSCVEFLLKHEIDVNITNKEGVTALHRAVDLGENELCLSVRHSGERLFSFQVIRISFVSFSKPKPKSTRKTRRVGRRCTSRRRTTIWN